MDTRGESLLSCKDQTHQATADEVLSDATTSCALVLKNDFTDHLQLDLLLVLNSLNHSPGILHESIDETMQDAYFPI